MSLRQWFANLRSTSSASLRIGLPIALLAGAATYITWRFVEPAPPARIVIAAGLPGGAYDHFANEYATYFAHNGFQLDVKPTAGSVENFKLLLDPASDVSVAIVQGGTMPSTGSTKELEALCSVFLEPLWVFYRGPATISKLSEFEGRRLAIGPQGSGVRALTEQLLAANAIDPDKPGRTTITDLTGKAAAEELLAGHVDAIFLVTAVENELVQKLLQDPAVHLMSFAQADAYAQRYPFLSRITLHRGVIDFGKDIPAQDIELIAPTAVLAARKSIHHGTAELMIRAARDAHAAGTALSPAGKFPAAPQSELRASSDAAYYLRNQPSRLLGGLPFWMKSMIDRMLLLIIPLIAVVLPLMRFAPALFRWSVRSRITRFYNKLKLVDEHLEAGCDLATLQEDQKSLERLDHKLATTGVPTGYMPDLYDLRVHLDRLRDKVRTKLNEKPHGPP